MDHNDNHQAADHQRRLLELLLTETETYGNHKETMAHAGLLLQIGIAASILTIKPWPPQWVKHLEFPAFFVGVVVFVLWLGIHVFIRWQLRNRRAAAIEHAALVGTLRKWANKSPDEYELAPYKVEETKKETGMSKVLNLIDFVVPRNSVPIHNDVDKADYPTDFVNVWKKQESTKPGALVSEWLLSIGSIIILALELVRTSQTR